MVDYPREPRRLVPGAGLYGWWDLTSSRRQSPRHSRHTGAAMLVASARQRPRRGAPAVELRTRARRARGGARSALLERRQRQRQRA